MHAQDENPTAHRLSSPTRNSERLVRNLATSGALRAYLGSQKVSRAGASDAVEPALSVGGRGSQNSKGRAVVDGDGAPCCSERRPLRGSLGRKRGVKAGV
jgi:hypothetical protein